MLLHISTYVRLMKLRSQTVGLFWFNAGKGRFVSDGTNIVGLLFFELIFLAFRIMFTVRAHNSADCS